MEEKTEFRGMLELDPKGFGFTRQMSRDFGQDVSDVYVPKQIVQKYDLRAGCMLTGIASKGKKSREVAELHDVNGLPADEWRDIPDFSEGIVIAPNTRIRLETRELTSRVLDLVTPIGRGQRALIVAPPRSGKTMMMQHIAEAITTNYDDLELLLLLVDERPEEVTEMERTLKAKVFASSNDKDFASHSRIAKLTLEYAKRQVEVGRDIVILLDSLTRLGRVFNAGQKGSGRIMSGGMDIRALEVPKRIFGASRKIEESGSLTIIATILVDTGSRMDELIFQEFKGTGNSEMVLDRELADLRIFPAMDIQLSGTRREELLLGDELEAHNKLRRALMNGTNKDAMIGLLDLIRKNKTNADLLRQVDELALDSKPLIAYSKPRRSDDRFGDRGEKRGGMRNGNRDDNRERRFARSENPNRRSGEQRRQNGNRRDDRSGYRRRP